MSIGQVEITAWGLTAISRPTRIPPIAARTSIMSGLMAAVVLAGCGGGGDKASTTKTRTTPRPVSLSLPPDTPAAARALRARVLAADELPGFVPQVLTPTTSAADWAAVQVRPAQVAKEAARLKRRGFIAGHSEQLAATDNDPAQTGLSFVERFPSAGAAASELAAQLLRSMASGYFKAFSVTGIPGARGFDLAGRNGGGHNVAFADGPYYYLVGTGWSNQTPSPPARAGVIIGAQRLYRRVHR
jgi:hypothetical protein